MSLPAIIGFFVMAFALAWYFILTLQWYGYRMQRAVMHHTKGWWNFAYFLLPFMTYRLVRVVAPDDFYGLVVAIVYLVFLIFWYRKLDKKLVFTGRVKRFFAIFTLFAVFEMVVFGLDSILIPLLLAWAISLFIEKILFEAFKKRASRKLSEMGDMRVVGVTASYGKTSIKNFIGAILSVKYRVYTTPRSVNTLAGILKDINEDIPEDTEVYVVEMGARGAGDIAEIATFVNPDYAVCGKIGPAHIEYFGTLENIRNTKMEILRGEGLQEAWIHESANISESDKVHSYGSEIEDVTATLEGVSFTLDGRRYEAPVLGSFNAENIAVAIYVARAMGLSEEEIARGVSRIEPVPHRLQRIDAGGKVILDDSFNGNIDGMKASFELASQWKGRKVLVTPGLVESDRASNEEIASIASEIFDLVIVTGDLNYEIFARFIDSDSLLHLRDKEDMQSMLAKETREGDLILFANDAPSFV